MRKMLLFALVLACSVSMVFAAVDINAESMASGDIASGTDIGGAVTSGNAKVEAAEAGAPYASVLVLPEGSSLSFDGTAGDVLKISQAIPADDTASGIMIESDSSSELIEGSSSDG